jgi:hypothetical protein
LTDFSFSFEMDGVPVACSPISDHAVPCLRPSSLVLTAKWNW